MPGGAGSVWLPDFTLWGKGLYSPCIPLLGSLRPGAAVRIGHGAFAMLKTSSAHTPRPGPIPIDARAADHLRYIRETMESAAEFTAVPGWGGVAMGVTAVIAAGIASLQTTPRAWFGVWLVEAFIAVAIAAPAAASK